MKFRKLALLALIFFSLQSCVDNEAYFGSGGGANNPEIYTRLADIIKHENVPTDTIAFNPLEDSNISGTFGVEINIPANSCILGSNELPDELFVVLREYPTLSKMALSNVQTESNQEMLVTGGNFWWKIIDAEGRDWDIVQPSQITATQPVVLDMGEYAEQAAYFTGNIISGGSQQVINWTQVRNNESGMGANNIFQYFGLQLNWANVDALYQYPGDRTQFSAVINPNDDIQANQDMMILIVDDFPSVINIYTKQGDSFVTHANAIPVGLTGTLVAVALDNNDQLLIGSTEITVAGDDEFTVDVTPGSMSQLTSLINQASN